MPLVLAAALIIFIGGRWARTEAEGVALARSVELRAALRADAVRASQAFLAVLRASRRPRPADPPFAAVRLQPSERREAPRLEIGGLLAKAEALEHVEQKRVAALREYELLLEGELDPALHVEVLRRAANLERQIGDRKRALGYLDQAARVVGADDEGRLRAAAEAVQLDAPRAAALLRALESGSFSAAPARVRAHLHESLGGARAARAPLAALAALRESADPDACLLFDDTWIWLGRTAEGIQEVWSARPEAVLAATVPGFSEGRSAWSQQGGVELPAPFPGGFLDLGPRSKAIVDGDADAAFRSRLGLAIGSALTLVSAAAAVAFIDRRRVLDEKRRRDFVYAVTHELKTPIANILLHAETIHEHAAADPLAAKRFAGVIGAEGRRLLGLVQQVLDVAGGRRQARPLRERFPAQAVLDDVLRAQLASAAEGGVVLRRADGGSEAEVVCDRALLERALGGLVENAVNYAAERVEVGVTRLGDRVRFSVDDDGPGVAAADHERIFEPFVRLHPELARKPGGMGLGLALVRQCAEGAGGVVTVEASTLGGARFVVDLPAAEKRA